MSKIDRSSFHHDSTTQEVIDGISLEGKTALVTGGTAGLGIETARTLAAAGAKVIITARDMARGEQIVTDLRSSTGNNAVSVLELELGSFASIRNFAQGFLGKHKTLDILINNAGVMACPFAKTEDGFELQFGSNHLGHFLMTNLVMPSLLAAGNARIVSVSSMGHRQSDIHFDDINFETRPYDKWLAYSQSKTANVLFAVGLEKRLAEHGVHAYALHPGAIMTELGRHMSDEDLAMIMARFSEPEATIEFKSVEAGAATSIYAATAPELEGRGGFYLENCGIAEVEDADDANSGVRPYALDPERAERLWQISEEYTGHPFSVS